MSDAIATVDRPQNQWHFARILARICAAGFILLLAASMALGPIGPPPEYFARNDQIQKTRTINLLMFSYSNDKDGDYPDGQSSTEVFQKLLDGRYTDDPTVFYVPLAGKTCPLPGQKLKPENVSFDVTWGIDRDSSDQMPVVFTTGYRVRYTPGSTAVPLIKPFPRYGWEGDPGFIEWLTGWRWRTVRYSDSGGMAVAYKSNRTLFIKLQNGTDADASIPNFVPANYTSKPDDIAYRQLTPDGPLP